MGYLHIKNLYADQDILCSGSVSPWRKFTARASERKLKIVVASRKGLCYSSSMTTETAAKLTAWGCAEIQRARGRGAIVMTQDAVLEPVSVRADMTHEFSPVCRVSVPVILGSRKETVCHHYFNNREIARICGQVRVA